MKLTETSKFKKLRKKIKAPEEKRALIEAIQVIISNPEKGKKLKGEFKDLRFYKYICQGQPRRLIYKRESDSLILFSFGPGGGRYKYINKFQ